MKAYVLRAYDSLELSDVPTPVPAEDEVLVRVHASSINPYDWHNLHGEPYLARLIPGGLGLRAPKLDNLGGDIAGRVEAVGKNVTRFRPGDDVLALIEQGGFAEYACVREELLLPKPTSLSYEQAAAVPMAGLTAMVAVCEAGALQSGQKVLVTGASGGVGSFTVQIARTYGAEVTGVCNTRHVALVRSIGAARVIDYTAEDFTRNGHRYDLLIDIAGARPVSASRSVLNPQGTFVVVGGPAGRWLEPLGRTIWALAQNPFVSQRVVFADTIRSAARKQLLLTLTQLIEDGKVTPVIDRSFSFEDIPAAISYQEQGHAAGKVVVTIA